MTTRLHARSAQAFTLLEVLVAVAIFAIVVAAIHTVFFGALRLRNATADGFEKVLPLQHTLATFKRDLYGIVPPGGTFSGQFQTVPTNTTSSEPAGRRVSPDIQTNTGIVDELTPWGDVRRVAYYLRPPTNGLAGLDLFRAVTPNLLPVNSETPAMQRMMGGVDDVQFLYYDGTSWINTWDSTVTTNLPRAIKVQIALTGVGGVASSANQPVELVVPVMVRILTNSVAQTAGGGA